MRYNVPKVYILCLKIDLNTDCDVANQHTFYVPFVMLLYLYSVYCYIAHLIKYIRTVYSFCGCMPSYILLTICDVAWLNTLCWLRTYFIVKHYITMYCVSHWWLHTCICAVCDVTHLHTCMYCTYCEILAPGRWGWENAALLQTHSWCEVWKKKITNVAQYTSQHNETRRWSVLDVSLTNIMLTNFDLWLQCLPTTNKI